MNYDRVTAAGAVGSNHDRLVAESLNRLAETCEGMGPGEQRAGFVQVMQSLYGAGLDPSARVGDDRGVQWIGLLADSGAFESAAVAMMPPNAIYTGGCLHRGEFIAQVVLESGAGAHSRTAKSLAMAWLAALLRATAREMIEAHAAPRLWPHA